MKNKIKMDLKKIKSFAALFSILLIVFYYFSHSITKTSFGWLIIFISIIMLNILSWFRPNTIFPIYRFWIFIGEILGFINSKIILGFLFIFVIIPYSVFYRLSQKDPMRRKLDETLKSYREEGQIISLSDKQY